MSLVGGGKQCKHTRAPLPSPPPPAVNTTNAHQQALLDAQVGKAGQIALKGLKVLDAVGARSFRGGLLLWRDGGGICLRILLLLLAHGAREKRTAASRRSTQLQYRRRNNGPRATAAEQRWRPRQIARSQHADALALTGGASNVSKSMREGCLDAESVRLGADVSAARARQRRVRSK